MKNLFLIILLLVISTSCEDFEGWNVDEKNPAEVPADYLVTSAEYTLFLRMTSISVNYNIFKYFVQNVGSTTYQDEPNYDLTTRDVQGTFWIYMYRDILADLNAAYKIVDESEALLPADQELKNNKLAQIELLQIFTWHVLVDTFGNVPYTEALKGGSEELYTPKYDDDEMIYSDLFDRINTALGLLTAGSSGFNDADLIYHGDTDAWIKFANTLKLKMALRISDANPSMAASMAAEAVAGGIFESPADEFSYPFEATPPLTNPLWTSLVQSGRSDFVVANTIVDLMVPLNDPRTEVYFDDNKDPYIGGEYGTNAPFSDYTQIGPLFHEETLPGLLLSYSESQFIMAEAIERGLVSGDAEMYYNEGVTASIIHYGGTQAEADAYLAQSTVSYGSGSWAERIGVQKYLALYMTNGWESWCSWRMLDWPKMNVAVESGLPVPRRYIYPNDEPNINGDNYDAASSAMGGDLLTSRVFWDINGQGN